MIAKKYRLTENEFKKVLSRRKPFFAHGMVANVLPNRLGYARIGILLGGKQAPGSVNRNYFRRSTYDLSRASLEKVGLDIVFVMKKGKPLDHKDPLMYDALKKDIEFLWKIVIREHLLVPKNPPG